MPQCRACNQFSIFTRESDVRHVYFYYKRSGNEKYSEQFICASCGPLHPKVKKKFDKIRYTHLAIISLQIANLPHLRFLSTAKQRAALGSKKSDFNRRLTNLKEAEVPFNEEFSNLIQQLRKEITCVVRNQRKYSARSVENIRQLQGRVIGTCTAILAVYYEG